MIYNFFVIFEKLHVSADQVYIFLEVSSKNLVNFAAGARVTRAAKFLFSKNRRELKYEYFFENFRNPFFYFKEQLPRRKFEIKSCLIFF